MASIPEGGEPGNSINAFGKALFLNKFHSLHELKNGKIPLK